MEYLTYNKLNDIIKRQYPIIKYSTSATEDDINSETYNGLFDFFNNPNFNKIKSAFSKTITIEPAKENKDDIDTYTYKSKNYI
jgi:hypothetical protein